MHRSTATSVALGLVLMLLSACASTPIELGATYAPGQTRAYSLVANARTRATIGGRRRVERTILRARSTVTVLGIDAAGTHLHVTIAPRSLVRDGVRADTPPQEEADLLVGLNGEIARVERIGGLPPQLSGIDVSDIAPLLGTPLPARRVHLGSTWTEALSALPQQGAASPGAALAAGIERGHVSALRRVHGYDCAIVELSTQRPVVRDRSAGGQPITLDGQEFTSSETAFALSAGFPVSISTTAESVYAIKSGSVTSGAVTVDTQTKLDLVSAKIETPSTQTSASPSTSPSASPSRT
jgi:hypothetical protein